jgi:hypothetical protein
LPALDLTPLAKYLLTAMSAWIPPSAQRALEPAADARDRYESIAMDMATVVQEEGVHSLFQGPSGRTQTALVALAVASFESNFRRDVDTGVRTGDQGSSWCLMQVKVVDGRTTQEGYRGVDLTTDRKKCFRVGLRLMRGSFLSCRTLPVLDRLSAYAIGSCVRDQRESQLRVGRAKAWWTAHWPTGDALAIARP